MLTDRIGIAEVTIRKLLSPQFKSSHSHNTHSNPFHLAKPHQIGSFLPLKHNSINSSSPSLSSFKSLSSVKSLSSLSPCKKLPPNMESNTSSPHSSNSITQPSHFPLPLHHTQSTEDNNLQFNIPDPFEDISDFFQQENNLDHDNFNDMGSSWGNSISPNSFSSYFNSDDALFRDPLSEPFSSSDPIDWGELQNLLQGHSSSLSPQTPLFLPGSHSSLQTGSSSSFHSAVAGLPASEFADLRIFPCWTSVQQPSMEKLVEDGKVAGKRKFDELSEVLEAANKSNENLVEIPVKQISDSNATEKEIKAEAEKIEDQEDFGKSKVEPNQNISSDEKKKGKAKVSSSKPIMEANPSLGIDVKEKPSLIKKSEDPASPGTDLPRRPTGRPPRPKHDVWILKKSRRL